MNTSIAYDCPGNFVVGDAYEVCTKLEKHSADFVFLDPIYEQQEIIKALDLGFWLRKREGALICFMYPEQLVNLDYHPDRIAHWVKPISPKNNTKQYPRFVEAIAVFHGSWFGPDLNFHAKTGVFFDTHIGKIIHPHQKPYSLVEKLIRTHCPPEGRIVDPFSGSRVLKRVADQLGYESFSTDKKRW